MRVKICGITNINDALNAIKAGADALGFVFYEKSPRYIDPIEAKKIVQALPPFVQTVALFVNESSKHINDICHVSHMQIAQIIDDKDITTYANLNMKYIKVLRVQSKEDLLDLPNEFILVDAFVEGFGGEGKRINKDWFKNIDTSKMILAGGLNETNLKEIKDLGFYGFDVSSGVEKEPGLKDKEKMINFIKVANES